MMLLLAGSTAMLCTPRYDHLSLSGFQVAPKSVVFHKPPNGAPAYQVPLCCRSNATALMRPLWLRLKAFGSLPWLKLVGPTYCQNGVRANGVIPSPPSGAGAI